MSSQILAEVVMPCRIYIYIYIYIYISDIDEVVFEVTHSPPILINLSPALVYIWLSIWITERVLDLIGCVTQFLAPRGSHDLCIGVDLQ